jgi:hypothetical protein
MPLEFSFGQIEAVTADLNRIASDKRVAFMGRMKQLQKQGLTDKEKRPGRGKAGTYSFGDLMKFVIAVELIQSGIMPQMAAKLVTGSWGVLRSNIYVCSFAPADTIGFTSKPTEYLWMLEVEALRPLTSEGEGEWDHMERIWAVPIQEAADALAKGVSTHPVSVGEGWRTVVLNGYNLTQRVMKVIAFHFGYATRLEMRKDIQDEIEADDERLRGLSKIFDEGLNLSPEERKALSKRLRETFETDFSTNPPTPRHVYVERAQDLIRILPDEIKEFLEKTSPGKFQITEEIKPILTQLIDLGVIGIEGVEDDEGDEPFKLQGIVVTPFGEVLLNQLGGEWAAFIAKRDRDKTPDPLDVEAEKIIAEQLSDEQRDVIRSREDEWTKEPFFSAFEKLGLAGSADGDVPNTKRYHFTKLGRAVLMALKYGKWRTDGKEPVRPDPPTEGW